MILEELREVVRRIAMAELRSSIFIDQLQPQTMCYLGTWVRGRLPRTRMAAGVIEIAPGLDIEPLTDVVAQAHRGQAGSSWSSASSATSSSIRARPRR